MARKLGWALFLFAMLSGPAWADDYRHDRHQCPHSDYSIAHYWLPTWYRVRGWVHPAMLDQFPPGPSPSVLPSFDFRRYPCPGNPPMPSAPYADPTAYFGRPLAPQNWTPTPGLTSRDR